MDALLADFHQFTMLQAYLVEGMTKAAVFEMYVRQLPPGRNFLVAAGLEQALDYLETLRLDEADIDWLMREGGVPAELGSRLRSLRFDGDVDAMPEGSVFFPHEPVLRVTAPLPMAQLVESRLLNIVHHQTVVASKAARMRLAAGHRRLIDFGMRCAHGAEAALFAARAAWITLRTGDADSLPTSRLAAHVQRQSAVASSGLWARAQVDGRLDGNRHRPAR